MKEKRWCYYVSETQDPELYGGYVPSRVIECEAGHSPMLGRGQCAEPWVWGKTLKQAQETCEKVNARMGIDKLVALKIVASSMFATRHSHLAQRLETT